MTSVALAVTTTAPMTSAPLTPAPPPTTGVPPPESELDGDWVVTSGLVHGEPVQLIEGAPITLTVEGFELSGVAACNDYGFTAEFVDGMVDNVAPYATEIGCMAEGVTELEQLYLKSIGPSATYVVDGNTLTWQSPTATWVFTRVPPTPPSPLVGTTWVLNGAINEFGGFSLPGIDSAKIVFADDGTFRGSTGCRDFTGTWTFAADIVTTKGVTIDGECTGAFSDVDEVVVRVLNEGFSGSIDGDHLGAHPHEHLGLDYFAEM